MKTPKHVGVFIVVGLALFAGLVGSAAAHLGGAAAITGSATFTDPAGDRTGTAADITSVAINGDPATGMLTIAVTAVGYSTLSLDTNPLVKVYLNTDLNEATGSAHQLGAEYYVAAGADAKGHWWDLSRWNGSAWEFVPASTSATQTFSRSGDTLTWTISKADLGGSGAFAFFAWSSTWDASDNQTGEDSAPDDGTWTYDLAAAGPSTTTATPTTTAPTASAPTRSLTRFLAPVIGNPVVVPAHPVAGQRLTLTFRVTRSDDHKPLTRGMLVAAPSIAGKVVPHTQSFTSGVARLTLIVPETAKGRQLSVQLTIKAPSYRGKDGAYVDIATGQTGTIQNWYSGKSATKIVSLPVR